MISTNEWGSAPGSVRECRDCVEQCDRKSMIPRTEGQYRVDQSRDLRDPACNEPGSLSSAKRVYNPVGIRSAKLRKSTAAMKAEKRHWAVEVRELGPTNMKCQVLPAGLMRDECRKEFLETVKAAQTLIMIDTDRKRVASGPAQPNVAYMELRFQRNAIVGERYSPPELRGGLRNFAPLAANLRQSGWRKKARKWWAEGAEGRKWKKISDTISFGNVKTGYVQELSRSCTRVFSARNSASECSRSLIRASISASRVRSSRELSMPDGMTTERL
ncbi:hypothetical protein B0H13DRAFT_2269211 [Mycena leptocephala]|nr:hypothetical protein B0H13DRAFT_2269211 [Mycena leptocephala]